MRSFTKDGRNSWEDYGWYISSLEHSPGPQRQVRLTVPYNNGTMDFNAITGHQAYDNGTLTIVFSRQTRLNAYHPHLKALENWLATNTEEPMYDSDDPGWYYTGTCTELREETKLGLITKVTATFSVTPFRTRIYTDSKVPTGERDYREPTLFTYINTAAGKWIGFVLTNWTPAELPLTVTCSERCVLLIPYSKDSSFAGLTEAEGKQLGLWAEYTADGPSSDSILAELRISPNIGQRVWIWGDVDQLVTIDGRSVKP